MENLILSELKKIQDSVNQLVEDKTIHQTVTTIADVCLAALQKGGKILFAGNGGSAADSQHLAAELVSKLQYDRPGLAAVALTTDTSALTAIGNDYGYDVLFARQLEAVAKQGDVFIGISTSGNSENILKAFAAAKKIGVTTIGFASKTGGKMPPLCDYMLNVPATQTPKIQECHIILGHIICAIIEEKLFGEQYNPNYKKNATVAS